jgi:hypothetical protein
MFRRPSVLKLQDQVVGPFLGNESIKTFNKLALGAQNLASVHILK